MSKFLINMGRFLLRDDLLNDGGGVGVFLLLEDGTFFFLEDGSSKIILEA